MNAAASRLDRQQRLQIFAKFAECDEGIETVVLKKNCGIRFNPDSATCAVSGG